MATYVVTATRGERGWYGYPTEYPGEGPYGQIREAELRAAGQVLGVQDIQLLGYMDGDLAQAPPAQAIARIAAHLRRVQPQVVITFGPEGSYGHPDHIAISQFTTAAVLCAADGGYADAEGRPPHRVSKLYYLVDSKAMVDVFQDALGESLTIAVDGVERRLVGWEQWAITTVIDTAAYWQVAWRAFLCHASQRPSYAALEAVIDKLHQPLLGTQNYYRALSVVNGGRTVEHDLFEGVRPERGLASLAGEPGARISELERTLP